MAYTITANESFNSLEIFFDEKPNETIRTALKALKFRWHRVKKCWYGYSDEETVKKAIDESETALENYTMTAREGYMGAIAWDGNNSHKFLYGADLTKALRDAFKKCNIKGVTVRAKTYSGGQSIYVTICPKDGDLVSVDEYANACTLEDFGHSAWMQDPENGWKSILTEEVWKMPEEEQRRLITANAKSRYESITGGSRDVGRGIDEEKIFTDQFKARLHAIKKIVNSFNYDDSNSMVDYFDRGFYDHYNLKKKETA